MVKSFANLFSKKKRGIIFWEISCQSAFLDLWDLLFEFKNLRGIIFPQIVCRSPFILIILIYIYLKK